MMNTITTIGLDLAKQVFQIHGSDSAGNPLLKKRLRRGQVLKFFADLPPCLVGMEACSSAHHWARELSKLGHEVRLYSLLAVAWVVRLLAQLYRLGSRRQLAARLVTSYKQRCLLMSCPVCGDRSPI